MWVYKRTEGQLWTVGFYTPAGVFFTDSDHDTKEAAAARVHYLNGGKEAINHNSIAVVGKIAEVMGMFGWQTNYLASDHVLSSIREILNEK
jgi:erythromycin esterase-like protein